MAQDVITEFFQRIWVDGDDAAIDQLFSPGARAHGIVPDLLVGPEEFHIMVPAFRALVRDISFTIEHRISAGDWLWALVRVNGYSAISEQPATITGQVMARVADGRVAEAYNHFDFIPFFEDLGLLPANTLTLCMTGQRIA